MGNCFGSQKSGAEPGLSKQTPRSINRRQQEAWSKTGVVTLRDRNLKVGQREVLMAYPKGSCSETDKAADRRLS